MEAILRDNKGRFIKGHKMLEGSQKGWFTTEKCLGNTNGFIKGHNTWNKGKKNYLTVETIKKMRIAKLGKKLSKEHISKLGLKKEKNPNWHNGASLEKYSNNFNNEFKKSIRDRDNYKCVICDIDEKYLNRKLEIHHIDFNKLNTTKENCISLCRKCHLQTNYSREIYKKLFFTYLKKNFNYNYINEGNK